jgi:DNA-binding NtrC family response regulator
MKEKAIRLLMVDDEEELVLHYVKRLERRGLHVVGVTSGADAVQAVETERFDVAIVDLKMPGMDGLTTLRHLKARQPFLEVIILTGHGSLDTAHESGRLAAATFLSKPVKLDELLEYIQEAAESRREALRAEYERELKEIIASSRSPHEIMEATARLQKRYEQ